jgi:hypothetical protein
MIEDGEINWDTKLAVHSSNPTAIAHSSYFARADVHAYKVQGSLAGGQPVLGYRNRASQVRDSMSLPVFIVVAAVAISFLCCLLLRPRG